MRGERGKNSTRSAAVALGFARAKDRVRFVNHDNDRTECAHRHEDAHLLPLSVTNPFRAELANLHHGQTALAGEAIDEKRFANPDPARDEDAPFEHIGFAILNQPGEFAKFLFCGRMRGDTIETDAWLRVFKADEPLTELLDQSFLPRGH